MQMVYLLTEALKIFPQRIKSRMFDKVFLPFTRKFSQYNNTCFKVIHIKKILFPSIKYMLVLVSRKRVTRKKGVGNK